MRVSRGSVGAVSSIPDSTGQCWVAFLATTRAKFVCTPSARQHKTAGDRPGPGIGQDWTTRDWGQRRATRDWAREKS